jgi:hypothetical protein
MSWWTTKGAYATKTRQQEEEMIRNCVKKWGDMLVHVCDRAYASGPWIQCLQTWKVTCVMRWIKKHHFFASKGEDKKGWQIGRGKKYLAHKQLFDGHTGEKMPCALWWTSVWHARYASPLSCVTVRVKQKVWSLIPNEPVKTEAQAWELVVISKRRVSRWKPVFARENAS